ncbi:hypothetical protein [Rhodoplanes sp. Z2-YC6860]|uniref:hypothetical protein n=1 Tax=Rhodoplanes sp. Z2-YC6860 TaxID=674703 RepID=UPI0012EE8B5E|nr:hypothetical protein [Rhodoplanes sp. Z2-YC6860]
MAGRTLQRVVYSAAFMLGLGLAFTAQAAPINPGSINRVANTELEQASFWGLPFPYGYEERPSECVRYVRVKTRHGVIRKRVWVCD